MHSENPTQQIILSLCAAMIPTFITEVMSRWAIAYNEQGNISSLRGKKKKIKRLSQYMLWHTGVLGRPLQKWGKVSNKGSAAEYCTAILNASPATCLRAVLHAAGNFSFHSAISNSKIHSYTSQGCWYPLQYFRSNIHISLWIFGNSWTTAKLSPLRYNVNFSPPFHPHNIYIKN